MSRKLPYRIPSFEYRTLDGGGEGCETLKIADIDEGRGDPAFVEGDDMQRSMRIIAFGIVAGLATTLAACSESSGGGSATGGATSAGGDIKIGVVLDITGAGASLGVPERQTIEMLADQVNAAGGVNNRKIKLYIEDNQSTEDLSLIHISEPTRPY